MADETATDRLNRAMKLTGSDTVAATSEAHDATTKPVARGVWQNIVDNPVTNALRNGWEGWGDILSGRVFDKSAQVDGAQLSVGNNVPKREQSISRSTQERGR